MARTVSRLFDSHLQALEAISDLESRGVDHGRISLVSNNARNWHDGHSHSDKIQDAGAGDFNSDGVNDTAEGARKGATAGGVVGGGAGVLAGLGLLAIPGLGPVVAAGWLAAAGTAAVIGAAAGAAAGGLLGALKEAGHSEEDANAYAEGVRRGGTLVSVKAKDDEAVAVESVLNGYGGVEASRRAEAYRETGWSRFDPAGAPYSLEEMDRERILHGEPRAFADSAAGESNLDDRMAPRPTNPQVRHDL